MAETEKKTPGSKSPGVADTPEFKAAVDAAVEAAMAKLATQLADARKEAGTGAAPEAAGDLSFMRQLALSIAEISDQGTHRKRVAPEILAKRGAARERMGKLILEARAKGLKPEYRLTGEVYLNETRLQPFTVDPSTKRPVPVDIIWTGAPNECMRPLNQPALTIFNAFMESIGGATEGVPGADKRPLWVTQNGLTIKGVAPAQRRAVSNLADSNASLNGQGGEPAEAPAFTDDLVARRANDPTAEFVNVLGTVAPPARQNFPGGAEPPARAHGRG